ARQSRLDGDNYPPDRDCFHTEPNKADEERAAAPPFTPRVAAASAGSCGTIAGDDVCRRARITGGECRRLRPEGGVQRRDSDGFPKVVQGRGQLLFRRHRRQETRHCVSEKSSRHGAGVEYAVGRPAAVQLLRDHPHLDTTLSSGFRGPVRERPVVHPPSSCLTIPGIVSDEVCEDLMEGPARRGHQEHAEVVRLRSVLFLLPACVQLRLK
ncbi:unnamed protein product, partial [Ixodes persulcatus]